MTVSSFAILRMEVMMGCVGNFSESANWIARVPSRDIPAYLILTAALFLLALFGGIFAWVSFVISVLLPGLPGSCRS